MIYCIFCIFCIFFIFCVFDPAISVVPRRPKTPRSATSQHHKADAIEVDEYEEQVPASDSVKRRRTADADGLALAKSGRVSMSSSSEVNTKYDASYRNSDNTKKLLGRSLSLGQAVGIIAVALYGAEIPMEKSG